jgi:hypothetical protein
MNIGQPAAPSTALPEWEQTFLAGRARSLLRAGVPLSLLVDLADASGPHSSAVYAAEPADSSWAIRRVG